MGRITTSILLLLIAVSVPLLYRQYADDRTVNYLTSYYSNYKMIDQFLRQSAGHIDHAKTFLPDTKQFKSVLSNLNQHMNDFIVSMKDKPTTTDNQSKDSSSKRKDTAKPTQKDQRNVRLSDCPGEESKVRVWSKEELSDYDGRSHNGDILLGFLGLVYNVTINAQHYGPGADYHVFAGRDATRAFVTGNFTHDLTDDIRDIDESNYSQIETWASFYAAGYPVLGRIEGSFFNSRGCGTNELFRVYKVFSKLAEEKTKQQQLDKDTPECNSEYNSDLKKGRVWCTTQSGGIERNWAGVPRIQIASDGQSKRCVCLNLESSDSARASEFAVYPGCDPKSSECTIAH